MFLTSPCMAQTVSPALAPADLTSVTAKAQQALSAAQAAQAIASNAVTNVNGVAPVNGTVTLSIPVVPSLTPYALKTDLATTTALAATAIQPTGLTSAITAATPGPCSAPLPDTFAGSTGVGTPCMSRPDATRPTQVQPATATTAADGSWSATWPTTFGAVPMVATATILGGVPPYICSVISKTATTVTGKCYGVVSTTLPTLGTALLGLAVSPIANPGAGLTVMVVGRL